MLPAQTQAKRIANTAHATVSWFFVFSNVHRHAARQCEAYSPDVQQLLNQEKLGKAEWLVGVQLLEAMAGVSDTSDCLRQRIAAVRKEVVDPKGAAAKRKQTTVIAAFKRSRRDGGGQGAGQSLS
eukprot:IDg1050t1